MWQMVMLNQALQDNARRAPTFLVFSLSVVACLWLGGQRAAGDESTALYDTAPLSFPVEQLRAWADKQETLQPKPSIRAAKDAAERKPSLIRLLNEQRFYFATDGTVRTTSWEIFRVKDKEGASSASRVDAMWEPWHKDRPTIEARVINPDGSVITNDGKDAIEQPAGNSDPSVMTDSRQLTLLLHGVELNSIVEIKISNVERMEAGAWFNRASMTDFFPAKVHRLVIEHDKDVKLTLRCVGPELTPQTSDNPVGAAAVKDAQPYRQIVYHVDLPQPPMDQMETGCGPDRSSLSTIEFGTPRAWTELGKHYAQSVEKAIGDGNKFSISLVKSVAAQSKAWTAREKVVWCDQQIRKALRYTSLAFGEQRIYPVSPDTVFARRFGDCKDHATLLVAMLREMGVTSHVALVSTTGALDVPQDAGAFGLFNHAITYVPEIDQWVDLTAEDFPVGMLPLRTQGRRALICDPEAGRIIRTPMISAAQNQSNEVRSYDLNFSGGGHVTIGLACKGNFGLELRSGYEQAQADQLIEGWKSLWMIQEADGKWTVSPSHADDIAQRLGKYCDNGDREQAGKWLEVIMPPLVRELPWFDNLGGSPAARIWSMKEDSRRIELTCHMLLAESGILQPLEKWLGKNTEPLPANIEKIIQRLRARDGVKDGKFSPLFELELKQAEETKNLDAVHGTVMAALRMQRHSHEPFDIARIQAVMEKVLTAKSTDPASKIIEVHFALLTNDDKRAFDILETMLDAKKVGSSTLNTYLWSSIMTQVDEGTLKERLARATRLQPENAREDQFYLHTLACAQAICGDPLSAAENLAELAGNRPDASEELLRGLILEQLDMPQACKSSFEYCIELEPYSDSAVIAKHRLEMNR